MIGFSGQAAEWLFDDVKATWLYGCFASTVVTAHAFCALQVAGSVRMLDDNPDLPDEAQTLEELATIAVAAGVIDIEHQARLVELHDRCRSYSSMYLREDKLRLERHLIEAEALDDEDPLFADARRALEISIELLYLRP